MNYYNENNLQAAAWLEQLINEGLIPHGVVDRRDIKEVSPRDVSGFTQCHFFAGIGGWSFALQLADWPASRPVWSGSCPCQPFSTSGKQLGEADARHLWPWFHRLIRARRPSVVFGEQVASPLGRQWLSGVQTDLERTTYEVGAADLCAAGVKAPHLRQRLYWVAYRKGDRRFRLENSTEQTGRKIIEANRAFNRMVHSDGQGRFARQSPASIARHGRAAEPAGGVERLGFANGAGPQGRNQRIFECAHQWPPGTPNLVVFCEDEKSRRFESGSFPLAHGIPGRVGLLRGYGNAILPQLAAEFIQAFVETQSP